MEHETHSETIEAEFTEETGLEKRQQAQISIRHDMSPESLRSEIERQSQMQELMVGYVRDKMVKDHHYYSFNEGGKPALTKDGAHRICSLFKCFPGPVDIEIIREDGGHFTVISRAVIFNQDGMEIASSRGSASTRESKYAYRWVYDNNVPSDVDVSTLKSRSGVGRNNKAWKQYQLPNPDLADLENTIIKMSEKRATVGAVNKLPLVSELFAADPDDHPDAKDHAPTSQTAPKSNRTSSSQKPAQSAAPSPAERDLPKDADAVQLRADVGELLKVKFGGDVDSITEYLKGRNPEVMLVSALEKMRDDLAAM